MLKPIGHGRFLGVAPFRSLAHGTEIDEVTHWICTHPLFLPTLRVWRIDCRMARMVLDYSDESHRFYDHAMTAAA